MKNLIDMKKEYHYEIVSRYLYMLSRDRLAFIVGLTGAMGNKQYYSRESIQILVNSKAR